MPEFKRSDLLGREVWWCSNEQEAEELVGQGVSRGEIYTQWERRLLFELRENPALVKKMDECKQIFQGRIVHD